MSRDPGDPRPPRQPEEPTTFRPAPRGKPAERPTPPPGAGEPMPARAPVDGPAPPRRRKARLADHPPKPESGGPTFLERVFFGKVSSAHLTVFCRQFAAYQEAGVPLLKTLDSLQSQFARTALGPVLGRLQVAIRRGDPIAEAMAREPQAFDPLMLSMMRVAEARGGVPETLRTLADHYESRRRLLRQARSAMIYPSVVLTVAFAVIFLITTFVLPAMLSGLEMHASSLPGPTRLLMAFSHFMEAMGWWAVPLGVVAGIFALLWAYGKPAGRRVIDSVAMYLPVLGKLLRMIDTARLARCLSSLLGAGVDLGRSLDLTADVLRIDALKRSLGRVREAVVVGSTLSDALAATHQFGPDVVAIVESGEETGLLPETLGRLADDLEDRIAFMVKNLGHLIQPLLMLIIGGIVFFIAVAFVMAYVSMLQNAMTL